MPEGVVRLLAGLDTGSLLAAPNVRAALPWVRRALPASGIAMFASGLRVLPRRSNLIAYLSL
jgi:hypothetical protein